MKKWLAVSLALIVLCGAMTVTAYAKDLEPCYHCNSTGQFHCPNCDNKVQIVCDGCHGAKGSVCTGEEGKGPCDHGYYTCPSCHGDTYARSGEGTIPPDAQPGTCSTCSGKGKLECWTCHGSGWNTCTRCDGKGKVECQNGNCKESRKVNWKCHYCMGAGYLLTNFWPGENDGVQNVPVNGDKIWVNGKSTTYSGGNTQTSSGGSQQSASQTAGENPVSSGEPMPGENTVPLPEDRNTDFEIPVVQSGAEAARASAKVEMGSMSAAQQQYYAGLPEEELAEILTNVQQIVGTAQPGRADGDVQDTLFAVAKQNGYENIEEAQIFPIYFEGHQGVGFPVRVSVTLEKGVLDGGRDIFAYHITPVGEIESLGKAEYSTYDDGSVEKLSFYTTGFSSFFTAAAELNTDLDGAEEPGDTMLTTGLLDGAADGGSIPPVVLVIAAAVVLVGAGALAVVLIRKKKTRT